MSTVAMRAAEEIYLGLFVITFFWALFSGALVVASVQARERSASSFLASSLVAAYCFGRLL